MIKGKRIYIAGSGGMLGEAFYKIYSKDNILRCTDKDVNESWLEYLDFRDAEAYKRDVEDFRPNYIFKYLIQYINFAPTYFKFFRIV